MGSLRPNGFRFWGPRSWLLPRCPWALGHLGLLWLREARADTPSSSEAPQPWLPLDHTCLVELSERALGSLKAKCRFLGDDRIQALCSHEKSPAETNSKAQFVPVRGRAPAMDASPHLNFCRGSRSLSVGSEEVDQGPWPEEP